MDNNLILTQLKALLEGERDTVANLSNASAALKLAFPQANWVGFYLLREEELVLGPFQGKPACIRIPLGRGVCGRAAQQYTSLLVPDVHAFPGHIACDSASRSELVIPLVHRGRVVGVLDLDSPLLSGFSEADQATLEACARLIVSSCDWQV